MSGDSPLRCRVRARVRRCVTVCARLSRCMHAGGRVGWKAGKWQEGRQTGMRADRQADKQEGRHMAGRQTGRHSIDAVRYDRRAAVFDGQDEDCQRIRSCASPTPPPPAPLSPLCQQSGAPGTASLRQPYKVTSTSRRRAYKVMSPSVKGHVPMHARNVTNIIEDGWEGGLAPGRGRWRRGTSSSRC